MTAQSLYSHKELQNKSSNELQEFCFQKGANWNNMPDGFKRGRLIAKEINLEKVSSEYIESIIHKEWTIKDCFDFVKDRETLNNLIPKYK